MSVTRESVQELLSSEDFGQRISGINQLRQLEPAVAFELIKPVVTDNNTRVRYAAVSQLDTLGSQDLQTTLTILRDRLLNDKEPDVQAAAADALGALKLTEAYEDIQQLYHQTSEWLVQFSIIAALGELGDVRAVPLLIPFASDSDWQIRFRVAQALSRLGGVDAHSTLETLTKDENQEVAKEAQAALQSG